MTFERTLLEMASASQSLDRFGRGALELLRGALEADVGLFATATRGGSRAEVGFDPEGVATLASRWAIYGRELHPVQAEAARAGATTDRRTLGGALERTRIHREIMAPASGTESLFVVPTFGGRKLGLLMLGRCRPRRFSQAELDLARSLAPCLAVAFAALASVEPAPDEGSLKGCPRIGQAGRAKPKAEPTKSRALLARSASVRQSVRGSGPIVGQLLSAAEEDLMGYLELGYTSREIAHARGTSYFTVRNQLSALYRKLGVSNRTEAVGRRGRR